MNKIVEDLLNWRLTTTEKRITEERDQMTSLVRATERSGRLLDELNQEKRAIKDHLEAAK